MFSRIFKSFLSTSVLTILTASQVFAATTATPDLPREFWVKKPGLKVILLEFSAPWCGSCQKLKPHVEALIKEQGPRLHVVDLNVEKPETEKYINLYKLDTAPTYILYNPQGKVIEKVEREITPVELKGLVLKALNAK